MARWCPHKTAERLDGTGRRAAGGATGVIVSSSPASAANCLDEYHPVAASQLQKREACARI